MEVVYKKRRRTRTRMVPIMEYKFDQGTGAVVMNGEGEKQEPLQWDSFWEKCTEKGTLTSLSILRFVDGLRCVVYNSTSLLFEPADCDVPNGINAICREEGKEGLFIFVVSLFLWLVPIDLLNSRFPTRRLEPLEQVHWAQLWRYNPDQKQDLQRVLLHRRTTASARLHPDRGRQWVWCLRLWTKKKNSFLSVDLTLWTDYGDCSVSCGPGTQIKTRRCEEGGLCCIDESDLTRKQDCETNKSEFVFFFCYSLTATEPGTINGSKQPFSK